MQRAAGALALVLSIASSWTRAAEPADAALTGYVGRITTVNAWHDIVTGPSELEFADAYLQGRDSFPRSLAWRLSGLIYRPAKV